MAMLVDFTCGMIGLHDGDMEIEKIDIDFGKIEIEERSGEHIVTLYVGFNEHYTWAVQHMCTELIHDHGNATCHIRWSGPFFGEDTSCRRSVRLDLARDDACSLVRALHRARFDLAEHVETLPGTIYGKAAEVSVRHIGARMLLRVAWPDGTPALEVLTPKANVAATGTCTLEGIPAWPDDPSTLKLQLKAPHAATLETALDRNIGEPDMGVSRDSSKSGDNDVDGSEDVCDTAPEAAPAVRAVDAMDNYVLTSRPVRGGGKSLIQIWSATGELRDEFEVLEELRSVICLPGNHFVGLTMDGRLLEYDIWTKSKLRAYGLEHKPINMVARAGDNELIVVTRMEVMRLAAESHPPADACRAPGSAIMSTLQYSKPIGGTALCTRQQGGFAVASGHVVRLYDGECTTGRKIKTATTRIRLDVGPVKSMHTSPDGRWLVCACPKSIVLVDAMVDAERNLFTYAGRRAVEELNPMVLHITKEQRAMIKHPFMSARFVLTSTANLTVVAVAGTFQLTWTVADAMQRMPCIPRVKALGGHARAIGGNSMKTYVAILDTVHQVTASEI